MPSHSEVSSPITCIGFLPRVGRRNFLVNMRQKGGRAPRLIRRFRGALAVSAFYSIASALAIACSMSFDVRLS